MAHFAKLDENNVVIGINVVGDADCQLNGVEDEATGIAFLTNLTGYSNWKQTSYNTHGGKYYTSDNREADDQTKAFRGNYAGIGSKYDSTNDIFIHPKPFASWTLNTTTATWEPPVAHPEDALDYVWDEDNQQWVRN
jgi:hypothetical protein|tara:strand:- start:678 stop:1088 length:411 start_codon:yes stop_codon:yes gene_type:complete